MQKLLRLLLAALVITSLMVSVTVAADSPEENCYPPSGGICDGAW